jgi:ribosome-associated protein
MRDVPIRGDEIGLGQLLKFVGIAESGGAARALLEDGVVRVNGEPEARRGRRLHHGDVVEVESEEPLRVVAGGEVGGG